MIYPRKRQTDGRKAKELIGHLSEARCRVIDRPLLDFF